MPAIASGSGEGKKNAGCYKVGKAGPNLLRSEVRFSRRKGHGARLARCVDGEGYPNHTQSLELIASVFGLLSAMIEAAGARADGERRPSPVGAQEPARPKAPLLLPRPEPARRKMLIAGASA
jgi:hypothetical protein